jgi:hypothetical protein
MEEKRRKKLSERKESGARELEPIDTWTECKRDIGNNRL